MKCKKTLLACLFSLLPMLGGAAELPAYPFIHVNGVGSAIVMPDIGTIDFEIAAQDADPALALKTVEDRVVEIRALMQQFGVADGDLEIRDIRREMKPAEQGSARYDIRCGVKIIVRNLTSWKLVVSPLLDKPNLDGFMTAFDTTERAKVEIDLMGEAIRMARRKADGVAAGLGRKVGAVSGVSTGELKNLTRAMNLSPAEFSYRSEREQRRQPERADLVIVTTLKLSQPVDVIFRIK